MLDFFKHSWLALILTIGLWAIAGWEAGLTGAAVFLALVLLEVTFSFDNAVVNARLLKHMSPFWQKLFLTVGIFIAVFVIRFLIPIFIVQLTAGLGFIETIDLAINDTETYGRELESAAPMIEAFGGTFLLLIGLAFFLDQTKDMHWFGWVEAKLSRLGRFDNVPIFAMLILAVVLGTTAGTPDQRLGIFLAAVAGVLLHMLLDLFEAITSSDDDEEEDGMSGVDKVKILVGGAAAVLFARLEVIDASFSFDGVIGAFAVTNDVLLIMLGLGAGAVWVRSMTVYLVRQGTLGKIRYLEHGAFWAILALGVIMMFKLYGVHVHEVIAGGVGVLFVGLAVWSSKRAAKRDEEAGDDNGDAPELRKPEPAVF